MSEHSNLTRGTFSKIATTPVEDGKVRFCTDEGRLFIDYQDQRIEISDLVTGMTTAELEVLQNPLNKFYIASDTKAIYYPCAVGDSMVLRPITGAMYVSDIQTGTAGDHIIYNFYLTYAYDGNSAIITLEVPTMAYVDSKVSTFAVNDSGVVYYLTYNRSLGQQVYNLIPEFGRKLDISENSTITSMQTDIGKRVYDVGVVSDPDDTNYGKPYYECLSVAGVWKKYYIPNFGRYLDIYDNPSITNIYNLIAAIDVKIADHERRITDLEQRIN